MNNRPTGRRFLLLYLRTGGGHAAAASAISEQIRSRSPESVVIPLDGVPAGSVVQRVFVESGYRLTGIQLPIFWAGLYEISKLRIFQDIYAPLMGAFSTRHIARAIMVNDITDVVVFHYLLARQLRAAVRSLGKTVRVTVIVTDPFSAHPIWFYKHRFPTIVFSDRARASAIAPGLLPAGKVAVFPPILRPQFDTTPSPTRLERVRKEFGLSIERPMLLIAAGGDGLPGGSKTLRAISASRIDADIVVVCGRDQLFLRSALRVAKRHTSGLVVVRGYVETIRELMCLASIIVTKAGPAMVMEALLLGRPLIISRYAYGQERGNVDFVVRNRLGFYEDNPRRIAHLVGKLLADTGLRNDIQKRIATFELRNGTDAIVDWLIS